ncbi:MAG: PEGA domain-containing protein [Flavobacteriales bacterium]|nr:PEGA domain-containing protein [Crocinitomicaceae bacterium]NBX80356.1 PEGA domain-containing protein [Flavobacteriales bacterium]
MRKLIAIVASVFFLQSCATIITGKLQTVTFVSQPPGANVIVDGENIGVTPITKEVPRKSEIITFSNQGYQDYTLKVKKSTNGWSWGNFVFLPLAGVGPLIGVLIDNSNGSGYVIKKVITQDGKIIKLLDNTVDVKLNK